MTTTLHHSTQAYRGQLFYFTGAPNHQLAPEDDPHIHYHRDGLLLVADGKVVAAGDYATLSTQLHPEQPIEHFANRIIMPGFIDSHVHYPQSDIIASPAADLLPWLNDYTFPAEIALHDAEYAREVSEFFLDELLRQGTTTAMVYCTSHPNSVEQFFQASHDRNLRMIAGKVLMDRNSPPELQDTAESGVRDSEDLLQRWHGTGRQLYAITPRFAPTSSETQLAACSELAKAYPDVYLQTHVAESQAEIAWVNALFPHNRSYLDIYDQYGLLRPKAVFGHCIWLDDTDLGRMRDTQSVAAHCPTSNLFLGSGLFDVQRAADADVLHTLATDVGAGTSFSLLRTMDEAHKVARLKTHYLRAIEMFYLCTLGASEALGLDDTVGSFKSGNEADFIVVDPCATPLLKRRYPHYESMEEMLFALAVLGDDRCIEATYAAGVCVHKR